MPSVAIPGVGGSLAAWIFGTEVAMRVQLDYLRVAIGVVAAVVAVSGTLLVASASTVSAPEPARLNGNLSGNNTWNYGIYINSNLQTTVVQWPGTWASNTTLKAGTPCFTYAATAGTATTLVIQASGNYRRCA